jgi:bifunctional DNase/RNase
MVKVVIDTMALDPNTNTPVMVLKEEKGVRTLPIWIGIAEASAIALYRSNKKFERPLTHDLMKLIIEGFHARLVKIVIDDLKDNTFFAKLYLEIDQNKAAVIDARPSDAVALALRLNAPLFVEEKVWEAQTKAEPKAQEEKKADELRKNLRDIDPSDFGKYSLG